MQIVLCGCFLSNNPVIQGIHRYSTKIGKKIHFSLEIFSHFVYNSFINFFNSEFSLKVSISRAAFYRKVLPYPMPVVLYLILRHKAGFLPVFIFQNQQLHVSKRYFYAEINSALYKHFWRSTMDYELFLQLVKEDLEKRLGENYLVTLRSIPKNNGVVRDGISVCRRGEQVAPTIYLNDFFREMEQGRPLLDIFDTVYQLYEENPGLPYLDSQVLASYQDIKDRIVYKLINTQANRTMLNYLPHMPFHDMSMVCYLLMEQREQGYVTAMIHKEHLQTWEIQEKELFLTALENTPKLLPPTIQPMSDVLRQLAKEALGENYQEEMLDALLEGADRQRMESHPVFPTLYVLSNPVGVNGAACMTYPQVIRDFARQLNQDILILPSSIHEVLLVADCENYHYEEMSLLVKNINETEVSVEDRLSNQIYRYHRDIDQIKMVTHAPALSQTVNL